MSNTSLQRASEAGAQLGVGLPFVLEGHVAEFILRQDAEIADHLTQCGELVELQPGLEQRPFGLGIAGVDVFD